MRLHHYYLITLYHCLCCLKICHFWDCPYLVWLVAGARLEWFCLEDDEYRPQLPGAQGVLHSRIFPGLRLPVAPLLAGDTAKVLDALTQSR